MTAAAEFFAGDQVNGNVVLQQLEVGLFFRTCQQRIGDGMAGRIGGVNDAPCAVATFAGQVKMIRAVLSKRHADINQPLDGGGGVFHGKAHAGFMTQTGTGDQGVLHVGLNTVVFIQHRRHAALSPACGACIQAVFADDGGINVIRQ